MNFLPGDVIKDGDVCLPLAPKWIFSYYRCTEFRSDIRFQLVPRRGRSPTADVLFTVSQPLRSEATSPWFLLRSDSSGHSSFSLDLVLSDLHLLDSPPVHLLTRFTFLFELMSCCRPLKTCNNIALVSPRARCQDPQRCGQGRFIRRLSVTHRDHVGAGF